MPSFSYHLFDPAVMADPRPFYRTLRDQHPVYYIEDLDTFALSRFDDIWDVLAINDGTFVASEGTLPSAAVLAQRNDRPVPDPPLHPLPFHANFDAPLYDDVRRCTAGQFRPKSAATLQERIRELANQRLDELLPRGSFDLTQEYGGGVAASIVCELVGLPADLAAEVLETVNAGSLAEPGSGVEVANARPGYLDYLIPVVARVRAGEHDGPLPIVEKLLAYRLPDGSPLTDTEVPVQMLGVFIGGTETVPKIVAHGLWELHRHPDQLAAIRDDPTANIPVAREEVIRYCAPAQWFARTVRRPFTIHDTEIRPGQRIISLLASANRDEREYPDPEAFIWDRRIDRSLAFRGIAGHQQLLSRQQAALRRQQSAAVPGPATHRLPADGRRQSAGVPRQRRAGTPHQPRPTLLPGVPPRAGGNRGAAAGMAAPGPRLPHRRSGRPPPSFQWGWNTVPVEV